MEAVKFLLIFVLASALLPVRANARALPHIKEINVKVITSISGQMYELKIQVDGTVDYKGDIRAHGKTEEGHKTYRMSPDAFGKIANKINDIDFFRLQDKYFELDIGGEKMMMTDQGSTIVTVLTDSESKTVEDELGAPKRLHELEELIFKVANVSQWLGSEPSFDDVPSMITSRCTSE
jgi:hypothetical protein